jgi:uncharacterized protein (TIGR00725 family)
MIVAVIGSATCTPAEAAAAETVGRLLAEAGAVLVCGGRGGVMAAACRGAKSAGGLSIGILPGTDSSEANPWVDVPIVTGLGEARNAIVARTAESLIAVGGSHGTLSEIAFALKWGKPVVGFGTWQLSRGGVAEGGIIRAQSPEEAVALAFSAGDR